MRTGWLLALVCCKAPLAPEALTVPMAALPPHFRTAYDWVYTRCWAPQRSAIPFRTIRWYVVSAPLWVRDERIVEGEWIKPATILLNSGAVDSVRDGTRVVRHELLHAIRGVIGHPPVFRWCDSLAVAAGWTP